MKSESRKRTARNKTGATDKDSAATNANHNDVDADYARLLLADAEALLGGDEALRAGNASVAAESVNPESGNTGSRKGTSAKANKVVSESTKQSSVSETTAAAVVLPMQCVLRDVIELKSQLSLQLQAEHAVQIDVSRVERIDASVMQLLLAFVRDRAQRARQVEWLGVNEVIMEAARILGLQSALQLPAMGAA